MATETEPLRFTAPGGHRLAGVLHHPRATADPDRPAARGVLLAHCFTCSKQVLTMTRLARGLADHGYAVLRFDFTGLGESEGEFGATNLASGVGDVTAASRALHDRVPGAQALVGHSLGGAAALLAAPDLPEVGSVVTLGTPASPAHLSRVRPDLDALPEGATTEVVIAGRPFEVERRFLDDLDDHDQQGAVAGLDRPLLVLHAVDDEVVPIAEGERIFAAARQPKAFHPLLGTDHLLRDRAGSDRALELVAGWLDATLAAPASRG